jgi:hypothetical protein
MTILAEVLRANLETKQHDKNASARQLGSQDLVALTECRPRVACQRLNDASTFVAIYAATAPCILVAAVLRWWLNVGHTFDCLMRYHLVRCDCQSIQASRNTLRC